MQITFSSLEKPTENFSWRQQKKKAHRARVIKILLIMQIRIWKIKIVIELLVYVRSRQNNERKG